MSVDVHSQSPYTIAVVGGVVISAAVVVPVVSSIGNLVVFTTTSLVVVRSISLVVRPLVISDSSVVATSASWVVKNGASDDSIGVVIWEVTVETTICGVVDDFPFKQS